MLGMADVLDIAKYERVRDDFRKRAMEAKAVRRVAVGPLITVFFENRLTMHYQLQEMMRVERMVRDDKIEEELKIWNDLIPADDQLSLTLMIEEPDVTKAKARLMELKDLEACVSLRIGARRVKATFEHGWKDENRISAVQFIRFDLDRDDRKAFDSESDVRFTIDHDRYAHEARLTPETLAALRADLRDE
jgi:hypothetical protein